MHREPSLVKGLFVTLALYLLALPLSIVPMIGPVLAVTFIPYIAGAMGARLTIPGERLALSIASSIIWCSLLTLAIVLALRSAASISPMGFRMDGIVWLMILFLWLFITLFSVLGARFPWRDPFREPET